MGADMKNALFNSGIFYCFIDDFYTGNANEIKVNAPKREVRRYLEQSVRLNVKQMMESAYRTTRIDMSAPEKKQFYDMYIKPMFIEIDEDGNLSIQLKVVKFAQADVNKKKQVAISGKRANVTELKFIHDNFSESP